MLSVSRQSIWRWVTEEILTPAPDDQWFTLRLSAYWCGLRIQDDVAEGSEFRWVVLLEVGLDGWGGDDFWPYGLFMSAISH